MDSIKVLFKKIKETVFLKKYMLHIFLPLTICSIFLGWESREILIYNEIEPIFWKALIITLLIIIFGFVTYLIRLQYRLSYGIIEFFAGIMSVYIAIIACLRKGSFIYYDSLAILGGFYIIVRGMDNIKQGIEDLLKKSD